VSERQILVVDDQARPRRALAAELEDAGYGVIQASDGVEAWESFLRHRPDLVITDMVMPRSDGMDLLSRVRAHSEVPVIMFTAYGTVDTAVSAMKEGADEFVVSEDLELDDLVSLVEKALERGASEKSPDLKTRLVGASKAMARVREQVSGLAPLWTPVLVSGESGTGRDTVVAALHELGATAGTKLVRVDGASFSPENRIPESGAIYLDGVEHLSSETQAFWAKRLAAASRAGSTPGCRIFASTAENLKAKLETNSFDRELGQALLRFHVHLPPLRRRAEDVPELVSSLVARIGSSLGRKGIRASAGATEFLSQQSWHGNVKQLEHLIERAVAFSRGREIKEQAVQKAFSELVESLARIREEHRADEREALLRAIRETGGNVSQTAEILGKSRSAVYRLIEKHSIALERSG
jgi:DNA-binding NtrC family response regulator